MVNASSSNLGHGMLSYPINQTKTFLLNIMMNYLLIALSLLLSAFSQAGARDEVTFTNSSKTPAICQKKSANDKAWIAFIRLQPNQSKRFNSFQLGLEARCNTELEKDATTTFTYFKINTTGVYDIIQDRVKYKKKSKKRRDWHWTTVIVLPNGDVKYKHLDQ